MGRLGGMGKLGTAAVRAVLLVATLGLALGIGAARADDGRPVLPKPRSTPCVAPPAVMRRDHFSMLLHQRERTLRLGILGSKVSLTTCVNCHSTDGPDGKPIPVNAPGQFCDACHHYAAVSIDCFSCHATTPAAAGAAKTAFAAGGAVKP